MGWLEDAQICYKNLQKREQPRTDFLAIKAMSDLPESFDGIHNILFRSEFEGSVSETLSYVLDHTDNLERLFVPVGMSWSEVCSLNLSYVKDFSFQLEGVPTGERLIAPNLQRLCIFGYADLTDFEILINPIPHIDYSYMRKLEELELRHFQQVDPNDFQKLKYLKKLYISESTIDNLRWLEKAAYQLDELTIYSALNECNGIEAQQALKTLSLKHNTLLQDITPIEELQNLRSLDLSLCEISNEGNLRSMGIEDLIITCRDKETSGIKSSARWIIDSSVERLYYEDNRMIGLKMTEAAKIYHKKRISRPFEIRVQEYAQDIFKQRYQQIVSGNIGSGSHELTVDEYLSFYVQFAMEYCPFLKLPGCEKP